MEKKRFLDIHIATFNARSLRTPEKLQELELALSDIKWDIIGISEMRRYGEGIEDYGNFILHYKGETPGLYGVGFLVKKGLAEKIGEIKGVSERIAVLNIELPVKNAEKWSIIQAYSPTESNKKDDIRKIEKFYEDLHLTIENSHKNIIVMGDFNGQIGKRNNFGEEYTIGLYGSGKRTNNGERLVTFALQHKLSILNSFFKKKKNKKWTWTSPNGIHKNEIDFVMSNNPKFFKDVSIIHNLNFHSDHKMVRAALTGIPMKRTRKYLINNSRIVCTGESEALSANLKLLAKNQHFNKDLSIEEKYNKFIQILKEATRKTNTEDNRAISKQTQELLQERKNLIKGKEDKYKISEISKKINEQIRKDRKIKRDNTMKKHIEKTGGIKKAIKELTEKKDWMPKVKTDKNNYTCKRPEILELATDYYKKLYKSNKSGRAQINELESVGTNITPTILTEETMKAINSQKIDKTPGSDQITNELLKSVASTIAPILTELFNDIIETEDIPTDWTKSTIILLHKKGDKGDIGNYRPISLMSNVYKVFSKIILSRITTTLDENQPKEQAGFRSKFSTIDHIHVVRQIIQKYKEYNKSFYVGFVDFNKAFDSLEHSFIWQALQSQGVEAKFIKILQNIYCGSVAQVRLEKTGRQFPIERGVRQGDPISPKLFTAVLENIFRNINWEKNGININGENLNHLRFADDLVLFSECPEKLQHMLQELSDQSAKAGLSMNTAKTKIMTNSTKTYNITVNNEKIEYVEEYVYLGQLISPSDTMQKEIDRRIANTWKRYWSLSEIMKNKDMPMKDKRKVYNTCILPCLIYGCQTWALTKKQLNKINICQNNIERSITGIKRKDKIRLTYVKNITKLKSVEKVHKMQKWRWAGHMLRETQEKWTKNVTEWYPRDGHRSKGRKNQRWEDDFKRIAGGEWLRKSKDRTLWKTLEEAYVERQAVS